MNWLSERRAPVFVVATANDVQRLPPEFTRKGRFDEMFFVGLPNDREREAIWGIHLKRPKVLEKDLTLKKLVSASAGYTGAEIAESVVAAMFQAFSDAARPVAQTDLETALSESIPISTARAADISRMYAWGEQNAMAAG